MALAMMATMSTAALAAETQKTANQVWNTDDKLNEASSKMTMEVVKAEDVLVATVPIEIPVVMDTKGNVTVPDNAKIVNNGDKAIKVTQVRLEMPDGGHGLNYYLVKDTSVFEKVKSTSGNVAYWWCSINSSGFSATMFSKGDYIPSGNCLLDTTSNTSKWTINANDELPLSIDLRASKEAYKSAYNKESFTTIAFTIAYV